MNRKNIPVILFGAIAAALIVVIIFDAFTNKKSEAEFFAMDTYISVKAEGADGEKAVPGLQMLINSLDTDVLSRHVENSEISNLNRNGGTVSDKMKNYLIPLIELSEKSGGKFDPVLGAVSDLWNFGDTPRLPSDEELKKALAVSGVDKIALSENTLSVENGALIDFGAAGKGIALDEAKALLETMKIKRACVSVGGSILCYGGKKFTVGIRDPKGNSGSYIMTVSMGAGCISTSGSYEQCFEENGKTYHHILDPDSGYPVDNGLVSVTVISRSGMMSDALSTACFALGIEKGSALAEEYSCEAVFVTDENKIYTTDGIRDAITVTDGAYSFAQ